MVQFDQEALRAGLSRVQQRRSVQQAGNNQHGDQEEQQASESSRYGFDKNVFRKETGTGVETHPRMGRTEGLKSRRVDLDEHIATQFKTFLSNHLTSLLDLDPEFLSNPTLGHHHEKLVFDYLTTKKVYPDGRSERFVDDAAIEKFLNNGEGWKITAQLLEEQTALKLFGLGLFAAANPEGHRSFYPADFSMPLGIDQSKFNKGGRQAVDWLNQYLNGSGGREGPPQGRIGGDNFGVDIWPAWMRRWHSTGFIAGSAGTLAGIGYAALGPVGATLGAIPVAGAVIWHEARNGVMMDVRQTGAGLTMLKNNPAEAAYLKRMTGIDVGDFLVDAAGDIDFARPPEGLETSKPVDQILSDVSGEIITRMEFWTKAGVPLQNIDTSPWSRFINSWTGAREQLGSRQHDEIQDIFNRSGGYQDGAGNQIGTLAPGGYDPENNGIDLEGNITRYLDAGREWTTEAMNKILRREMSEGASIQDAIATMKAKREEMANPDGTIKDTYRQRRTEDLGRRKTRLEGYRTALTDERTDLNSYNELLTNLENARREARRISGGADNVAALNAQLAPLENNRNTIFPGSVREEENNIETQEAAEITAAEAPIRAAAAAMTPPQAPLREDLVAATAGIREAYERVRTSSGFSRRRDELDTRIKNLTTARNTILAAQEAIEDFDRQGDLRTRLESWERNHGEIRSWSTAANVLSNPFLAAGDIDAIMARINAARAADPNVGWVEARNNDPANRTRVIQAVLEARARMAEATDPARTPARRGNFNTITGWNISRSQLRYLTVAEINNLINGEFARSGNGWDAAGNTDPVNIQMVNNAIAESRNRISVAVDAITNQERTINLGIENIDIDIAAQNFGAEVRLLDVGIEISEHQVPLIEKAEEIIGPNRENIARFTDRVAIGADRTYSAAETAVAGPRGYYEFMNFLFNYREKSDRDTYFRRISQVLTPPRLRDFIVDAIPTLGTRTTQLNTVLQRLQNEATGANPTVNYRDMENLIFYIEETFRLEALAA